MAAGKPAAKKAATKRKPKAEPEPKGMRFTIGQDSWEIDPGNLAMGELEELEVYFDEPYRFIDLNSARGVMFMYYLARKRSEPDYTLSEAREVDWGALGVSEAERPTKGTEPADSGDPS